LVGRATGTIASSYATGAVTTGASGNSVGGLAGYFDASTGATLSGVYAKGAVSTGDGSYDVGGLIGIDYGAALTNLYATGAVS
ncbi:GLUG motif-containing protein, partial [Vibrio parahaemolyticus]